MIYLLVVPQGYWEIEQKLWKILLIQYFLNFILGRVCSIKFFKIPSFSTTFGLPIGILKGQFIEVALTKLKKIKGSYSVKFNFRWGLFSTKSWKNVVLTYLFPHFIFYIFGLGYCDVTVIPRLLCLQMLCCATYSFYIPWF